MRDRCGVGRVLWTVAVLLTAVGSPGASAESARPSILVASEAPAAGPPARKSSARERFVRIDRSALGEEVRLDLFPGVGVDVRRERTEVTGPAGSVWIGRVIGGGERVFLSTVGDATVGQLRVAGTLYKIRYVADGVHAVSEVDTSRFPQEGCGERPGENSQHVGPQDTPVTSEAPDTGLRHLAPPDAPAAAESPAEGQADPCNVIDTLLLYTPAARDEAGSAQAIEAEIHLAISVTNASFEDSGVTTRISPVHIDEIDYEEAALQADLGDAFDDRDALQDPNDGEMDEAHELRDRYCADVVHLITQTGGNADFDNNWCGAAYVMDPDQDPTFEVWGFATTVLECAAGNYTFAHEMGHLFGARHDWYVDDATTPYTYAHGYVNRPERWRTIMAYNTECDDLGLDCDRVGLWSNPNKFYEGDPAGIPEGTSTNCTADNINNPDCDAEDYRVLNANDCTVANFRDRGECITSAARNVWMKDTWFDTGVEPDFWQAGLDMWKSPYIWVRNSPDLTGEKQHLHQNPEHGQTNYVYVKLHNDFDVSATGQLQLYYAEASSGLTWPGDWTLFANNTVNIGAHATLLAPSTWDPPGTGHYCLLARWSTPNNPSDPMASPEGNSTTTNARMNNNIVQRNVNIANLVPNTTVPLPPLKVKSTSPAGTTLLDLAIEQPDLGHNFLRAGGQILLDLDGLHDNWLATGAMGDGVRPLTHPLYGDVVEILDTTSGVATLTGILLTTAEVEPVRFILTAPFVPPPPPFPPSDDEPPGASRSLAGDTEALPASPIDTFALDLVQIEGSERVGGVAYEIVVEAQGGSGAVPDGNLRPGTPLTVARDASGSLVLDWGESCRTSDVDYAVYAGTLGDFDSHTPLACSTSGATTATVSPLDAPGNTYFLVVPTDLLTEGSFGQDSRGIERQAGSAACRPHAVLACP